MDAVFSGMTCRSAALKFDIAANTVRNWYKRYNSEGNYFEKKRPGKKPKLTIWQIETYIKNHPNFRLKDMGKHFNISAVSAYYNLKKFGFTYKKKPLNTWKQTKKKERNT